MAQKVLSVSSTTRFFSAALLENIEATTTKGKSVIDLSTGEIAFSIPISSFQFDKSLMQEHFNEKYMETEKFSKANFSGIIKNWENGKSISAAIAKGKLTIHGVTKVVTTSGLVKFEKKKLFITAKFNVKLQNFGIEVPSIMFQKIAEVVEVTINYEYPINENK